MSFEEENGGVKVFSQGVVSTTNEFGKTTMLVGEQTNPTKLDLRNHGEDEMKAGVVDVAHANPVRVASEDNQGTPVDKKAKNPDAKSTDRDNSCINALLSLGRDLRQQEALAGVVPSFYPAAVPILPTTDLRPNKRQKFEEPPIMNGQGNFKAPPDFWYWLPPGESSLGEWDVLCGRGGESNNFVGNKKYRRVVNERKDAYRNIPLKRRKVKTAFVRSIVQHVNNCGGRFVDMDEQSGRYYVVTMEKARKKTSQALRETKELKWLEIEPRERKMRSNKNSICPFCKKAGHKTKIAKACLRHHEWLDANPTKSKQAGVAAMDNYGALKSSELRIETTGDDNRALNECTDPFEGLDLSKRQDKRGATPLLSGNPSFQPRNPIPYKEDLQERGDTPIDAKPSQTGDKVMDYGFASV